jgi:hypothetical protein
LTIIWQLPFETRADLIWQVYIMIRLILTLLIGVSSVFVEPWQPLGRESHIAIRPPATVGDQPPLTNTEISTDRSAAKMSHPSISFQIDPNYPIPFDSTTSVSYLLPEGASTELEIFDHTGRTLAILANRWEQAGIYQIPLGYSKLAVGDYFYQITTGKQRQVMKLTIGRN